MSKKAELDRAALYDLYRSYARNEKSLLLSEKFGRKSGDEDIAKDDGDGNITVRKNPKRRAKMTVTSYFEGCENEEDRLIFCDNCNKDVLDFCPTCGMLVMISDNPVPMAVPDRAKKTAPKLLDIRSSSIHGLGVFARRPLPAGIKFGPYEGEVTRVSTTNGYSWKLRNGKLIDAADETKSNWLRYVNCAPHMSMQNVVAFQYRGGLYYRTTRLIKTDEELLVYYGDSFARELGIEPKRYFDPTLETVLEDFYCCRYCKIGLSTIKFRDNHELKCKFKKPPVNLEKWYGCKHCPCYLLSESERDLHQKRCERKREKMDDDNGSKRAKSNRKKAVREDKDQIPSKTYFCNVCDFKTRYKPNLKRHLNIHFSTRLYSCRFCDKFFKQNFHLNKHYFRRHKDHIQEVNITSKPRVCSLCGIETFDLKSHKQVHMDYNDSSYKCQICERMFKRRFDFERHLKTHTGIQTYCCISCKQKFSSKRNLENHILTKHSKEMELMQSVTNKIHPCDSCSYRTSFISNLKSHIKTCKK